MKILLVYPQYPETFWSFSHALKIVSKKAAFPPLGLLTVGSMLPTTWEKKLVDLNVTHLTDADIKWADYVFISAMVVQSASAKEVIARCHALNAKTVCGGPLFTTGYEEFNNVDHFVLDEGEITLPLFLADVEKGQVQHMYTSPERPDITRTPLPMWSLIDMKKYASMSIQYSRGCPFNCEFCDIVVLNGLTPRTKSAEQMLEELDALYDRGWRSGVFIVDDNFIGNKKKTKTEILPAIIGWMKEKKYPFSLSAETSINLADDEELLELMTEANFGRTFIGIETPNEESLNECSKNQNRNRDMLDSVRKIQRHGIEVQGGFIVGFDSDPLSIFKSQINFIQNSGIATAMVGLLNAPKGTRLYKRLSSENRLVKNMTGDNMDFSLNFVPKMNMETLITGYRSILANIYSPGQYYARVKTLLKEYKPPKHTHFRFEFHHLAALIRCTWTLGIKEKGRRHYWNIFISTLFKNPKALQITMSLAVYGYHFRKVVEKYLRMPTKDTA